MTRVGIDIAVACAFGALSAFVLRQAVDFDGMAFLEHVAQGDMRDTSHPLYPWMLRGWLALPWVRDLGDLSAAKGFSVVMGAALTFALLRFLRLAGLGTFSACLYALLVVTAPVVWRQVVGIEVYSAALAATVATAVAAATWRARRRTVWAVAAIVSGLIAIGCHVGAVFALPFWLATAGLRPTFMRAAAGIAVAGVAAIGVGLAPRFGGLPEGLADLLARTRLFVVLRAEVGFPAALVERAWHALRFVAVGAPGVLAMAAMGLIVTMASPRRGRSVAWTLFATFTSAWLALGVPMLGLLLPALVGLALMAAAAAGRELTVQQRRILGVAAAVLMTVQATLAFAERCREAEAADPWAADARLVAGALPEGATVLSAELTYHLRRFGGVDAVALNELIFQLQQQGGGREEVVALLHSLCTDPSRASGRVYLETSGYIALRVVGVEDVDLAPFIDRFEPLVLRHAPPLGLLPLNAGQKR